MSRLRDTTDPRTRFDYHDRVVRSFFGSELLDPPFLDGKDRDITAAFLSSNSDHFRLDEVELTRGRSLRGKAAGSIRFDQCRAGIPVYGANLVVAIRDRDRRVISAVNRLEYDLPDALTARDVRFDANGATRAIRTAFAPLYRNVKMTGQPELFVYRHRKVPNQPLAKAPPGRDDTMALGRGRIDHTYLVWRVKVNTRDPGGHWEVLVDAVSGGLVRVRDRRRYNSVPAKVFQPDPIRSSQDPNLSWDTSQERLNAELFSVHLKNLRSPPAGGDFELKGKWVEIAERESPETPSPVEPTQFVYDSKDTRFFNVMAYYYLDRLITSLNGLGIGAINDLTATPVQVDPQAEYSHFVDDDPPYIALGALAPPDATDPAVVIHEYGHLIHESILELAELSNYEEGFCDFLAACWLDRVNAHQFQREIVFPWAENATDAPDTKRRVDLPETFEQPAFDGYDYYLQGSVFATALWDFYINIGGDSERAEVRERAADDAIATYLEMLVLVQGDIEDGNAPLIPNGLVYAMIEADKAQNNGLYQKVIWDSFRRRKLFDEFTVLGDVDVWIHDNPNDTGDHAGPTKYWTSQDIWTRQLSPQIDPDPNQGHQTPIIGDPNYLYVRVHNRGLQPAPANSLTVEAFHCLPGTGMLWPDDFISMGALGIDEAIPAGGSARVGPFNWVPVGENHQCLFAIVDGDKDISVVRDVGEPVSHRGVVRFDNNVGQRNVSPQFSVAGGSILSTFSMRGGRRASMNGFRIDSRALPDDARISLRVPRRLTRTVGIRKNLRPVSETSRHSVLSLTGGTEGTLAGFRLAARDCARITVKIDLPESVSLGHGYSLDFFHEQDGRSAGGMTFVVEAVGKNDDFFFGNRRSKELHTAWCSSSRSMSPRNTVPFSSVREALARGYKPCRRCAARLEEARRQALAPATKRPTRPPAPHPVIKDRPRPVDV